MIQPDIITEIKFFTSSEGGKSMPVTGNFSCTFSYKEEFYDCRLLLEIGASINPEAVVTETMQAEVDSGINALVIPPELLPKLDTPQIIDEINDCRSSYNVKP